jgi:hypothetical protein
VTDRSDLDALEEISDQYSRRPNKVRDGRAGNGRAEENLRGLRRVRSKSIRALLFASGNRRKSPAITLPGQTK